MNVWLGQGGNDVNVNRNARMDLDWVVVGGG